MDNQISIPENLKNTISMLKNFYIRHMVEDTYDLDYDKFWLENEEIIELEYKLKV